MQGFERKQQVRVIRNVYVSRPTRCTISYNVSLFIILSALHVSDSLVHHQERRSGAVYRNWYKPVRLGVVWL